MKFIKTSDRFKLLDSIFMEIFKHLHEIDVKVIENRDDNHVIIKFGNYSIIKEIKRN